MTVLLSKRSESILNSIKPVLQFVTELHGRLAQKASISDFAFGNPHEMPLPDFVNALEHHLTPQNKDWFAYKMSEAEPRAVVAESLRKLRGMDFKDDDICLTNGAFAAIAVTLNTIVDPGDEVIFNIPPWFFYETMILSVGGVPVRVNVQPENFDLDLEAIARAITPNTRAIIVNSPNNPTGKIYPAETLKALARILADASEKYGRPIYLLSDEAYSRIIFDGRDYPSPVSFYPNTFLIYTYGKTLLTPGQRMGYIALPPTMPNRAQIRTALLAAQISNGWAFPNALLQYALPDLEQVSIDIPHLQRKRDRLVSALREIGYEVHSPEGTFYLLPRSPWQDDWAFAELLGEEDILCLPGIVVELPGYFRLSLTANDDMIERAIPGFAAAWERAKTREPQ